MHEQSSAPRDGIVVASGFGLKIYVERSHLVVQHGTGPSRRTLRLSRATSGLERLVVLGHAGYITLEALRWIRDIHASFAQIGLDGELITISAAERFHSTKLRRAQALAADRPVGVEITRDLAIRKLEQQAERMDRLPELWPAKPRDGADHVDVGAIIRRELEAVARSSSLTEVRSHEAVAGRWYWQTLARLQVSFAASFRKSVPLHWLTAGTRTSPPSGFKSSRKAATPVHAILNYAYAILETEATITLHAHGLDPGLGILHTDKRYRGSLALDLMEPVRPIVDGLVLDLVAEHAFARGDVYETREGVCRLGRPLTRRLAAWAPALRAPLQEHAAFMTARLAGGPTSRPARERSTIVAGKGGKRRATPRAAAS